MMWFRLYHDLPSDRKLRKFSGQEKWAWVCLLCFASQSSQRGMVVGEDEEILAEDCGFSSTQDFQYYLDKLRQKGLIEPIVDGFKIVNWGKLQYASDSSKERVRKHRKGKCNVTETLPKQTINVSVTPPDTDTDTDPDPDPDPERDITNSLTLTEHLDKSAHAEKVFLEQDPETSTSLSSNNTPPSKHSTSGEEVNTARASSTIPDKNKTIWGNKRTKVSQKERAKMSCDMAWLDVGIQSMRWKDERDYKAFADYIKEHARQCNSGEKKDFKPVGNIPAFVSTVLKTTSQAEFDDFKSLKLWKDWNSEIAQPLFVATDEPKLESISSESMVKFEALCEANRLRKEREKLVQSRYERGDECAA